MYTENITQLRDLHMDLENDIKMGLKDIGYGPMAGSRD
jgi:hypothetical protein